MRTHLVKDIQLNDNSKEVTLCGWVYKIRDLGKMTFISLRDSSGFAQIIIDNGKIDIKLNLESCILVKGTVIKRPDNQIKDVIGGWFEISAQKIDILNQSMVLPIDFNQAISEEMRLKYRYLDLRQTKLAKLIKMRSDVCHNVRNFLIAQKN